MSIRHALMKISFLLASLSLVFFMVVMKQGLTGFIIAAGLVIIAGIIGKSKSKI